ncbi:hypothetical protein [Dyadobacter sp. 3J3]|uniref:hypothetical protein n=1 Tax=Dyadobacter sp. 3J3 TaxID=2606600 RepID=UPI00135B24D5|nr:hypothetical protein [Dyadobacter sp. 3J3]
MKSEYLSQSDIADILLNLRFVETTKGSHKREFRKNHHSGKFVQFNHINTRVGTYNNYDEKISLNLEDLRDILFYLNNNKSDFSIVLREGNFQYDTIKNRINELRQQVEDYKLFNVKERSRHKLLKVIENYELVTIEHLSN